MGLDRTIGSVPNDLGADAESMKRPESTTLDSQTKQAQPLDTTDETQRDVSTNLSVKSSDNSEPLGSRIVRETTNEISEVVTNSNCGGVKGNSPLAHATSGLDLSSFAPHLYRLCQEHKMHRCLLKCK